jgi:hypothetical protein
MNELFWIFLIFASACVVMVLTLTATVALLLKNIRELEEENEGLQPPF